MRNRVKAKSLCNDITQRTRDDMTLDVLEILKNTEGGLKITNIGHGCALNYMTTRDITDKLVKDGLIKVNAHGYYVITDDGIKYGEARKMSRADIARIVNIAREVVKQANKEGDENGNCIFCHQDEEHHAESCVWKRLNEIFNKVDE